MKHRHIGFAVAIALCLGLRPTQAWHLDGHRLMATAAIEALPEHVPMFLRKGAKAVAHSTIDPDLYRHRGLPELRSHEGPEHYFDRELFPATTLPATRYAFLKQCFDVDINPENVGLLPYAIVEWTQRLTIALAEHRQWPSNAYVQHKCLFYAGILSHYAADLCQPLHTTVHYDGRVRADGKSPRSGIHLKVDDLFRRVELDWEQLCAGLVLQSMDVLMVEVLAELERSHSLVDRVYALEAKLPVPEQPWVADQQVTDLAHIRARTAARFIGNLILTAWDRSAGLELPSWLDRGVLDAE